MKTWLVTGAAGFLGSHVTDAVLARGERVIALDNLSWGKWAFLEPFRKNKNFTFVKADIRDTEGVRCIMQGHRPDAVIHLAALHFIPAAIKDPDLTVSVNVTGTQSVLSACRAADVKTFWFASTGDVYAPGEKPHREDDEIKPFNIYGLSKLMGEELVKLESRQRPLAKFVIGRLFNLYGPRETNPHILPEIIGQLKDDASKTLRLGNLWPKRDLVPVSEAARAAIESSLAAPAGITTANFATGVTWSMEEVITKIGELRNRPVKIETDPGKVRSVERPVLHADVNRLKAVNGWTPSADLERGLRDLLSFEGLL